MIDISYEKEFVFQDGRRAKNLMDLVSIIKKLSDNEFSQFVNPYKNDFANWINDVLMEYDLAAKLRKTLSKDETIYIITTKLSSTIADTKDKAVNMPNKSIEKVHKTSGIMSGLFKKKEDKKEDKNENHKEDVVAKTDDLHSETRTTLSEPEKKPEQHEQEKTAHKIFHHFRHKGDHKEDNKPDHKETQTDGEGSSENIIWMLLYGLVIGLILILIVYRFIF